MGNLMVKLIEDIEEIPNIIYHGTNSDAVMSIKENIDLNFNPKRRPDFSKGFYTTANYKQAKEWAEFKANDNFSKDDLAGVIISFEVDIARLSELNSLFFTEVNEEWAEFIIANRSRKSPSPGLLHNRDAKFDIIYGPMADGKRIAKLIRKYENGEYSSIKEFLDEIRGVKYPFPIDHQISFHSEMAKSCLKMRGVDYIDDTEIIKSTVS
jgi:hypothetical protein